MHAPHAMYWKDRGSNHLSLGLKIVEKVSAEVRGDIGKKAEADEFHL